MVDWHSTSADHVREAQQRQGWTDEQVLERLLTVVRHGPAPDFPRMRPRLEEEYAALPPETSVADRVAFLTGRLPALSGIRGDTGLMELLIGAGRPTQRPAARTPRRGGRRPASYDARADWRRGLVIVLATWAVLLLVALALVRWA